MVIVKVGGGIGNQIGHYALGKYFAVMLDTELKLDVTGLKVTDELLPHGFKQYKLGYFNIQENFATPEEIERVKEYGKIIDRPPLPDLKDFHGDVFIQGYWMLGQTYLIDLLGIMREEFTLKNPLGATAQQWREKILAAECSVSIHVRHGDYLYNPNVKYELWGGILPLYYYYTCMDILKQHCKNLTAFVFSNNIQWCKENLRLDVPTEFVSGTGTTDFEELHLMSLCKHNIIASSTFSRCVAAINQNPDRKIFYPCPSDAQGVQEYFHSLETKEISPLDNRFIKIPYDFDNQPDIDMRPWFSLLMVVNNDIDTLEESLNSILAQDYKYHEVIIIDNASFDGSRQICQQAAKISDKVTLIKLYNKISNGAAWNKELNIAQGNFVMFLKGDDKIFPDALTSLYPKISPIDNVACALTWFREDEQGTIEIADKKFPSKLIPFCTI